MLKQKIKVLSSVAGYNLAADDYDKKEKYLNSFEKGQLLSLLGDVKDKKILDAGAGTGRISVALSKLGAQVTALDISEKMLAVLRKKNPEIITVLNDVEDLPFDSNYFDVVISTFLIVHLKDLTRFFDEVYRVLKDGGVFIVTNINQKDPPIVKTQAGDMVIESFYHRPEKVRTALEELAFGIVKEEFIREGDVWVSQIVVAKK